MKTFIVTSAYLRRTWEHAQSSYVVTFIEEPLPEQRKAKYCRRNSAVLSLKRGRSGLTDG
ncbi:uncharacterized protein Bfra_000351 [Botrytis fragariae]|uniref:Uncharacterized protein n=1 Tax=Botrytis fragariae TaxID=1964551 RepID=A0A8H6B2G6_9HELO|nr:uncharacterized protein Bfra_000351 [Botrytis fragariae]KAF5878186.1 hypothetical protein Bfra_000351 [Botrytis fragariae]